MATDMNSEARQYLDAAQAQLGERVTNLGRRQTDLESEMRTGFKAVETQMASLANEMRLAISGLSSSIAERSRPQWQALGVTLTFAGMLGALAYLPIREATTDLKFAVSALSEKVVTRQEMDWRSARGTEDRQRMESAIAEIRNNVVPRAEHAREWAGADQRFSDVQRQIDELKQAQGSVYGQRDIILDLKDRLNRIEMERDKRPMP